MQQRGEIMKRFLNPVKHSSRKLCTSLKIEAFASPSLCAQLTDVNTAISLEDPHWLHSHLEALFAASIASPSALVGKSKLRTERPVG
jgi:hypothetical protein